MPHQQEMRAAYWALVELGILPRPRPRGRWPKGSFWVSEEDSRARKERRRLKKIEYKRARRRAAGIHPRAETSINKDAPWDCDGDITAHLV